MIASLLLVPDTSGGGGGVARNGRELQAGDIDGGSRRGETLLDPCSGKPLWARALLGGLLQLNGRAEAHCGFQELRAACHRRAAHPGHGAVVIAAFCRADHEAQTAIIREAVLILGEGFRERPLGPPEIAQELRPEPTDLTSEHLEGLPLTEEFHLNRLDDAARLNLRPQDLLLRTGSGHQERRLFQPLLCSVRVRDEPTQQSHLPCCGVDEEL